MAAAVLVEHAIIVTHGPELPPPLMINGWSLSYAAVNAFFILSGFLIADSLEHRANVFIYAASRALRILPALVLLSLTATLVIGPVVTSLEAAEYWTRSQTWLYPVQVLGFLDTEHGPAGVYADLPRAGEFSATLWTLRYEVIAYLAAAIVFFTPIPWGRWSHLVLFALASAAFLALTLFWVEAPAVIMSAARLSAAFTLGMVIHGWRDYLPLAPGVAVVGLPLWLLSGAAPWAEHFMNITLASALFWIAFARLGGLPTASRIPDWSYGIYIWHYPVMQTVLFFHPSAPPLLIGLIAVPVTGILAELSWSWVEKPSLGYKATFGHWMQSVWAGSRIAESVTKGSKND
ncbi:acyltransferase family protein [Maricaulis sp.]|uniref:acyltransferase family protein n=1 Tax=Maricaulis sp. TaxID=1486257 RepID=UPI003A9120A5